MDQAANASPEATHLITPQFAGEKIITSHTKIVSSTRPTQVVVGEREERHEVVAQDLRNNQLVDGHVTVKHPVHLTIQGPYCEYEKKFWVHDLNGNNFLTAQAKVNHGTD